MVLEQPFPWIPRLYQLSDQNLSLGQSGTHMGAQLGVPFGHMGCRQFGVQFGYLDVYDLPFCVPYDVVLLLDVPVVLFCVPYDVVLLLDVPMDLCTQLYSPVQCTMYSKWLSMYLKYQT